MKTDTQLQKDVVEELSWAPDVEHGHIGVAAHGGVITLSGHVPNYAMKMAAEHAARRVIGVKAVAQEIEVRFASDPKTSDEEIAQRILSLFAWDVSIPDRRVQVKVEKGYVTLTGEVDWHYQKQAASKAAGRISGVKSVVNSLNVRERPAAFDVRERIIAALKRSAEVDANSIEVSVDGSTVRLGGWVRAWNERRIAEAAAWAAPGVLRVDDNIVLA
ncbi:BON domain-containing protein [Sphingomonas sp. BGYR3]|nr:BON domain-containing protein [Sphingomonas sp. BGYR3]MDG5488807.1 BON domain-containing protein [Sphingomonas sp. BGYR3]